MTAQVYKFTKSYHLVHLPWLNCVVGKVCLNKVAGKKKEVILRPASLYLEVAVRLVTARKGLVFGAGARKSWVRILFL